MSAHGALFFRIESRRKAHATRITVSGELDMATVALFAEELRAVERRMGEIEVDLSELTFIDASGLHALLAGARRARRSGRRFTASHPTPQILRLFRLTRIDRTLELIDIPS